MKKWLIIVVLLVIVIVLFMYIKIEVKVVGVILGYMIGDMVLYNFFMKYYIYMNFIVIDMFVFEKNG